MGRWVSVIQVLICSFSLVALQVQSIHWVRIKFLRCRRVELNGHRPAPKRHLVSMIILALLLTPVSLSADQPSKEYARANAAYLKGEFSAALALLHPLVEQGEPGPQSLLGLMYMNGKGVPADHEKANRLFRASAEQDHPAGQFGLGVLFVTGLGVPKSLTKAIKWLQLSANQGFAAAQYTLANIYNGGMDEIGSDIVRAYKWYSVLKSRYERYDIGAMEMLESRMTEKQIEDARAQAKRWLTEFETQSKK